MVSTQRSKNGFNSLIQDMLSHKAEIKEIEAQKVAKAELKLKDLKVNNYLILAIGKTILITILKKDIAH